VDERVGSPTIRLNEPIAFGGIEPLHSSGLQRTYPLSAGSLRRATAPRRKTERDAPAGLRQCPACPRQPRRPTCAKT
jgi:hypothetical protein